MSCSESMPSCQAVRVNVGSVRTGSLQLLPNQWVGISVYTRWGMVEINVSETTATERKCD